MLYPVGLGINKCSQLLITCQFGMPLSYTGATTQQHDSNVEKVDIAMSENTAYGQGVAAHPHTEMAAQEDANASSSVGNDFAMTDNTAYQ